MPVNGSICVLVQFLVSPDVEPLSGFDCTVTILRGKTWGFNLQDFSKLGPKSLGSGRSQGSFSNTSGLSVWFRNISSQSKNKGGHIMVQSEKRAWRPPILTERKRTRGSDSCSSGLDSSSCPISASPSISSSETGSFVRAHFILSFPQFFQFFSCQMILTYYVLFSFLFILYQ